MTKTLFKTLTFTMYDYNEDVGNEFIFMGYHINNLIKKGYKFTHIDVNRNEVGCYTNLFIRLTKDMEEDE